jgi:transposase
MVRIEDFINLLLDFGDDWVVTKVESNIKDKTVYLDLDYVSDNYEDPMTLKPAKLYDHSEIRVWRHLDILDYACYVRCKIPRVICEDNSIKQIEIGWADRNDRHTHNFEVRVIDLLLITKNQTKTAAYLNCSFRLVNRIIHRSTERGMARRSSKYMSVENISIDEKSFKKGHQYVTVISHPKSGIVLDVGEGRDTKSVVNLFNSTFNNEQLERINTISVDMWEPFLIAIHKVIPQAEIIHDRFHLVKYLNKSMDEVRRRETKEEENTDEIKELLTNSRYSLLKNEEKMTKKQHQKFEQIKATNLDVSKVWYIRQNFKDIFDSSNNDAEAEKLLINWATDSFMQGIKEVNKVILMILNHFKGVVNAMICNFTNAMAERLNGKIQEVKLCSRGYNKFENFRSAILFFHGGLNLYPLSW